jgi:LEA14-like dessication related protein
MKKPVMKFLLLVISALILFLAVNQFICTPKGSVPEIITVTGINILEVNSDFINLNVKVLAFNKNKSDISLENINLGLIASGDTLGSAIRSRGITMAAMDTSEIDFSANLVTARFVKLASDNESFINLKITGDAKADLGLITLPVDIDLEYKFDFRKKLIETIQGDTEQKQLITVESASVKSLSIEKTTVIIKFNIVNPYGIDLTLKDYPSIIYINENQAGEGNLGTDSLLLNKNTSAASRVIYELNNLKSVTSLLSSVFKRKLEYRTSGNLTMEVLGYEIQFPYSFKGELIRL